MHFAPAQVPTPVPALAPLPLLGLQLNPFCKFMTNELLFAVFQPNKKTQNIPAMPHTERAMSLWVLRLSEFFFMPHICSMQNEELPTSAQGNTTLCSISKCLLSSVQSNEPQKKNLQQ